MCVRVCVCVCVCVYIPKEGRGGEMEKERERDYRADLLGSSKSSVWELLFGLSDKLLCVRLCVRNSSTWGNTRTWCVLGG